MEYAGLNEVLKYINASVVVYKVNQDLQISMEYFNDRFAQIYGDTKMVLHEELKKDITFGVAREYKQRVKDMFYQVVSTGDTGEATYRAEIKTKEEMWVNMKATPVKNGEDTLVYVTFFNITEQIKAKEKAVRNEKYLERACEFANLFTWVYEIDARRIHSGIVLRDQIGLPEILENFPECIFELHMVEPEYEELYRNKVALLDQGEDHVEFEVKANLPDGQSHWIAYRFDIVEYEKGIPKIAIGTAQIIDVNKRLEARYQLEQQRKIVEDPTMHGYVISDMNTNMVLERKNIYDKMQFSDHEVHYDAVAEAFSKTIVSKVERENWIRTHDIDNIISLFKDGKTAIELELNVVCKDGVMRWVREVLNLVQHPESGEIILYNYFYDIHDQKVFGELMKAMADYGYEICGSLVADLDQLSVIYSGTHNHHMRIGSYSELNGGFSNIVLEEDKERYCEMTSIPFIKQETSAEKNGYEMTFRTMENGQIRYKRAQCYLYDRDDQTYLILRSDVTDSVTAEIEKRKQLERALAQAEEANMAKSNFLSRMSHELRTPLNAINGYTSLIQENVRSGDLDTGILLENIAITHKATDYLLMIISDILDIQSIEQGKTIIHKKELNLLKYLNNIMDMVRYEAEEKNIDFSYERKTDIDREYQIDGPRFQQVLLNVLHNAVKFTPEGGKVQVFVDVLKQRRGHAILKVSVADTGIGMAQDFVKDQLFNKFVQENATITSPYDGCGTGLFISRELMRLMGGSITCTSQKGKGSEFVLQIPIEYQRASRTKTAKRTDVSYDLSGVHVLLCEDNEMNQDMEKRILEKMNCEVLIADDGVIGVETFARSGQNYFDIILMDIRMPNMDGWEAAQAIRSARRQDAETIPILAVSANAFEADVQKSLAAGMNEHLTKPVDARILYQKITQYCKNNKGD